VTQQVLDRLTAAGGERLKGLAAAGAKRLRSLGDGRREQLGGLGDRGRKWLRNGPIGEKLARLRNTRGGQLAGEGADRVKQWGDEHPIARRRLLTAVPSAAGLALLAGAAETLEPAPNPRTVVRPRPVHPVERTAGRQLPPQHKPIFTLNDYRRVTGAPPFPADAIALTIDDGPHPVWTPKILRLLDKYHVPAMFCMIGNQVLGHEDVARTVTKAGHQLANHTWSHPAALIHRSPEQVRTEIERAQLKIQHTTGYTPKLFRSPGGAWSPTVLQETAAAGLIPLDWDNDPRDWTRPGVAHIRNKMMAARPGQILLCHDGGGDRSETYAALSTVLPALTAKGLRFVAL
jgi:peptidoglycan/xylan/chitin deacetylase (PgdA/CDA1 family)